MIVYCSIVFVVTISPPAGIVELTAFSGAVFAASFFPSIFGGLYLRWGTGHGALVSMGAGIISCVVWRTVLRFRYAALEDIHEVIPAIILAGVAYLVASLATGKTRPDHVDLLFGGKS
jgi:Na+/pantothenate symporter